MNWNYNEWDGDKRWDDSPSAIIEALRAIAEQLEQMNNHIESQEAKDLWKVS